MNRKTRRNKNKTNGGMNGMNRKTEGGKRRVHRRKTHKRRHTRK